MRSMTWVIEWEVGTPETAARWQLKYSSPTDQEIEYYDDDVDEQLQIGSIEYTMDKWRLFSFNYLKGMAFDSLEEAKAMLITLARTVPILPSTSFEDIHREIGFEKLMRTTAP
jgi:hypothetical protein